MLTCRYNKCNPSACLEVTQVIYILSVLLPVYCTLVLCFNDFNTTIHILQSLQNTYTCMYIYDSLEPALPENVIHRSIDIVQLLVSQAMALDDGTNQNGSQKNVTSPGSLNFTLYGLSSFTEYSVYAVATYNETNCNRSTYDGEAIKIRTERKCTCIIFCAFV